MQSIAPNWPPCSSNKTLKSTTCLPTVQNSTLWSPSSKKYEINSPQEYPPAKSMTTPLCGTPLTRSWRTSKLNLLRTILWEFMRKRISTCRKERKLKSDCKTSMYQISNKKRVLLVSIHKNMREMVRFIETANKNRQDLPPFCYIYILSESLLTKFVPIDKDIIL